MMIKIFPFIFILLWSSAFITTKPIIDNSDPFAALAFRFALVALGFFLFSIYSKQKILVSKRNFFESSVHPSIIDALKGKSTIVSAFSLGKS